MKPTIMVLGTDHLANSEIDGIIYTKDDALAPRYKREIEQQFLFFYLNSQKLCRLWKLKEKRCYGP